MTSNNAPVGKSSRTPDELVAGLEAVRVECLRTMTGDVLAGWNDVPPNYDLFLSGKGFARVEFRAETLAPLMADAVALIRRLDRRAADAEDTLYADREERAHRERARHARLRSAANEDDTMQASHEAGPDSVPFPESEHGVAGDIVDPIANVLKQYDNFRKTFGNVFGDVLERLYGSTESAVSDSEGSGEGDTPGNGGEAATRPYTPVAGDTCTDSEGCHWLVAEVLSDGVPLIRRKDGPQGGLLPDMEELCGPMTWHDRDADTGAHVPRVGDVCTDREGDSWRVLDDGVTLHHVDGDHEIRHRFEYVEYHWGPLTWKSTVEQPYVPAVGDKCEDQDGHTWTVSDHYRSNGEPLLRLGSGALSHESLSVVAETWGPLVWENGRVTDKNTTDTDNDAERDR